MPIHRGRAGAAGCGVLIGGTRRDVSSSTARARGQHWLADAQGHACGFPMAHRDGEGVAGAAPDQGCSSEATVSDPGWSLLRASGKESGGDWKESGGPHEGERAAEARHGAGHGPRAPDSCSCAGGSGEGGRGRSAEAPRSCRPEPVRPRLRVSAAGSPRPCVNGPLAHSAGSTVPRRAQWGHA